MDADVPRPTRYNSSSLLTHAVGSGEETRVTRNHGERQGGARGGTGRQRKRRAAASRHNQRGRVVVEDGGGGVGVAEKKGAR